MRGGGCSDGDVRLAGPVVEGAVGHCGDVFGEVEGGGYDEHAEGEEEEGVCGEVFSQ